jgi:hypothetical protein
MFAMVIPYRVRPDAKSFADGCFIVKNAILEPIRFAGVVQDETLVILRACVHNLIEKLERRKHPEE